MLDKKLMNYVELAMQGDGEAFAQICAYKGRDILYLCISLLDDVQDGEDAAQEVMETLYYKLKKLKTAEAFHVWLYKITRNVCINMRKRRYMKYEMTTYEENPVEEFSEDRMDFLPAEYLKDESKKRLLARIVRQLPFSCMMAVMMFYFDGMSYKDMGRVLDMTKKELDNTLIKSKKLIRRELAEREPNREILAQAAVPVTMLNGVIAADIGFRITDPQLETLQLFCNRLAGIGPGKRMKQQAEGYSTAAKATLTVLVTAGILVAAGNALWDRYLHDQTPSSQPPEENMIPQDISHTGGAEEGFDIETLEDMIDDRPAEVLREYARRNGPLAEVREFLEQIGMEVKESVYLMSTDQEYNLYILEKQDKLLLVIVRYQTAAEEMQLAYRFGEAGERIPQDIIIRSCFEQWREQGNMDGSAEEEQAR